MTYSHFEGTAVTLTGQFCTVGLGGGLRGGRNPEKGLFLGGGGGSPPLGSKMSLGEFKTQTVAWNNATGCPVADRLL